MNKRLKKWWRGWTLTLGTWRLVHYATGGVILFTSKRAGVDYIKNGGFPCKKFVVLPEGQRPKAGR